MNRRMFRYSFSVSVAMVLLSIVSSQGFKNTNRLVENSSPSAQPDVNLLTSAYKYLEKNKRRYHLSDPRSQLMYVGFTVDDLSRSHLLLQQMHNNVRVWGGELRVHFSGYTGYRYCAVALILGLVWLSMAWGAYKATDDRPWAKKLFAVSVLTIFTLNVMMSIDYARPVTQQVRPSYASQAGEVKVPLFRLE